MAEVVDSETEEDLETEDEEASGIEVVEVTEEDSEIEVAVVAGWIEEAEEEALEIEVEEVIGEAVEDG